MNRNSFELTLLSEGQIWGNDKESQLEVLKKYGIETIVTDLCILRGADFDVSKKARRTGLCWTKSNDIVKKNHIFAVDINGTKTYIEMDTRIGAICPVLKLSPELFAILTSKRTKGDNNTEEVEFGEYPQYVASKDMQKILTQEYNILTYVTNSGKINKTGRSYTFDTSEYYERDIPFEGRKYDEYEYQGKKYIYVDLNGSHFHIFLNDISYIHDDYVWIEVAPVKWLIDDENKQLISKYGLVSGIRFMDPQAEYNGDFSKTEMKNYLDEHMVKDLLQSVNLEYLFDIVKAKNPNNCIKKSNPYNLSFNKVSEEDIIKGAIESGVAVFLHGPSSEGKSARVKQIDPTCEIIYLRNATPDSLNGKSVYNSETGEMIDVPPTWLKKLQTKCAEEPDRLHILFFDEITNALPSIQGIAFNIVLDREVNGIWKLPDNARIVAAGNDMKDSLAANQLAEPLFNRFAHVYIKTTTESWLKWASENNIHPAIYSYIAYKNGETLRSKYDGEKPNADPRKWEMASKMLYKSGNPEMLRALVGEDITKEFVEFCKQEVITLEDVINVNYTDKEIESLNTAEKYATIMGLSQVDEINLEIVRNFVTNLGAEFKAVFDALWTHGNESRLEIIAELNINKKRR